MFLGSIAAVVALGREIGYSVAFPLVAVAMALIRISAGTFPLDNRTKKYLVLLMVGLGLSVASQKIAGTRKEHEKIGYRECRSRIAAYRDTLRLQEAEGSQPDFALGPQFEEFKSELLETYQGRSVGLGAGCQQAIFKSPDI